MAKKLKLTNSEDMATVDDSDYRWAVKHKWRKHADGHVVRDGDLAKGEPLLVYLCNEVMSRHSDLPLSAFTPPKSRAAA